MTVSDEKKRRNTDLTSKKKNRKEREIKEDTVNRQENLLLKV